MKSRILTSFLLGAAAGAVLGILYAPDKGANTREKLMANLNKYRDQLLCFLDNLSATNQTHPNGAFTEDESVTEAKNKANQLLTDVDEMLAQMRAKNKEA